MEPGQATKAAALLVGHKMYSDYQSLMAQGFSVEPERFYDMWMKRFTNENQMTEDFSEGIWRYFLRRLFDERMKRG